MSSDLRSLPLGQVLSGYRIDRILGQGGFGITYLATDVDLNRQVAVKEYYPREFAMRDSTMTIRAAGNADDKETFEWGLNRFLKEAQLLALFEHPNIISVRRFFKANGTAYLVMDYCDGRPLDDIIKRDGPLSEVQLEQILYPLLNGLEQVHGAGFLHRDIKPANLFIRADGSPVLLDFGSAIKGSSQHTRGVTTMVTDGYSPVEQYDSMGKQGPFTDIYGLAATLYRAATGDKPQASTGRILNDTLEPAVKKAKGRCAANLLAAIDAGMAVRPENRPQNVAEWRGLLGNKSAPQANLKSEILPRVDKNNNPDNSEPVPLSVTSSRTPAAPIDPENSEIIWYQNAEKITYVLVALFIIGLFYAVNRGGFSSTSSYSSVEAPAPVVAPTPIPVAKAGVGGEIQDCDDCPIMRLLPAGDYLNVLWKKTNNLVGAVDSARAGRLNSFYVAKYELTNKEWNVCAAAGACQRKKPQAKASDGLMPVTNVNWYDAQAYAVWLSKETGKGYQLLSESQWEYAAEAGQGKVYSGSDDQTLNDFAWYRTNSKSQMQVVGGKLPNAFGLYDMSGNVSEWTADCWNESYTGGPTDGSAWVSGQCGARVIRGGSWNDESANLRSTARSFDLLDFHNGTIGIRLARKAD